MLIRELMLRQPIVVQEDTSLGEIAQAMLARQAGCVVAVDGIVPHHEVLSMMTFA